MADNVDMTGTVGGMDEAFVQVIERTAVHKSLERLEALLPGILHEAVAEALVHAIHSDPNAPLPKRRNPSSTAAIRTPKAGGRCAAVWTELDKLRTKAAGVVPALADILRIGQRRKWNPNNTRVEYYQWRKSKGISGRLPVAA